MHWQRPPPVPFGLPHPHGQQLLALPADFCERPWLDRIRAAAVHEPDAIAVVDARMRVTRREFLMLAERAAGRIAMLAPRGGAVAMIAPDTVFGLAGPIGCLAAGRICISLDPAQPAERLAGVLRDAAPGAVVTPADVPALVSGEARPLPDGESDPDAPAAVHYTSGRTGRPTGIATSRFATLRRARIGIEDWGRGPSDRLVGRSRLSSNAGLPRHARVCRGRQQRSGHPALSCLIRVYPR